jgi:hypothetical protein
MAYAAIGLAASIAVHVLSFFGTTFGGQASFVALHVGIFPLWIAVVLIAMNATTRVPRKEAWRVAFSGCPAWMKYMTYAFCAYALVNFAIFAASVSSVPKSDQLGAEIWRGFSGHWMVFYSAGLAFATTAYSRGIDNWGPQCRKGHAVGPGDNYCPVCGDRVDRQPLGFA